MDAGRVAALLAVVAGVVLAGVVVADFLGPDPGGDGVPTPGGSTTAATEPATAGPTADADGGDDSTAAADGTTGDDAADSAPTRAVVTLHDENGTELGTVRAHLADTPEERYTGLSPFESLANGSGMLFVFPEEGSRTFVMRRMDFPLDMVFVGSDGRITTIHHAPVPPADADELERYPGRAQWVLEVPRGWTTAHGVAVGDRIEIEYPSNATLTPTPSG